MRIKLLLAATLFLLVTGVSGEVRNKTPVDDAGNCVFGEEFCIWHDQWSETVNGVMVVHAGHYECYCI